MKPHDRIPLRRICSTLVLLSAGVAAGCLQDTTLGPSDDPLGIVFAGREAGEDGTTPPPGLATVSLGAEELVLWPYTGSGFDGSPEDPVNVIFAGEAHPLQIRAALLSLDGNRPGLPPVPPFNARWTDVVGGGVQTAYTEGPLGWTGSVVQLTLGDFGPIRFHLRLFTTGRDDGGAGTWTVGAAHFELQIPGTAEHQVLSWEIAEQVVVADLVRSGLLDPSAPMQPTGPISAVPSWRTIPAIIYNGLPPDLVALIGGPPQPVSADVPIPSDGSATIFRVASAVPIEVGDWHRAAAVVYDQIVPKPFCVAGPGEYFYVTGPVDFATDVSVLANGRYAYRATYSGQLEATPVNLVAGELVPVGNPLRVRVRGDQEGFLSETDGRIHAQDRRMIRGSGEPEMWTSHLVAPETGRKTYLVREKCLDSEE